MAKLAHFRVEDCKEPKTGTRPGDILMKLHGTEDGRDKEGDTGWSESWNEMVVAQRGKSRTLFFGGFLWCRRSQEISSESLLCRRC